MKLLNNKFIWISSLVLYMMVLFYAVFLQYETKFINEQNINQHLNLVPFTQIFKSMVVLMDKGIKGNMNLVNNLFGNIVLFIPLPIFMYHIFNIKSFHRLLLIGSIISLGIEGLQYLLLLGVTDIDDLILNVMGVSLGYAVLVLKDKK